VTARAPLKGGSCKAIVCSSCEKEFAGCVQRILEYYAKCKSTPSSLREWAVGKLGRSAVRREGKGAVKKMEGMFEDIAFETDQVLINATAYCDCKVVCDEAICNLVYKQRHQAVGPSTTDTAYSRQEIVVQ
jgi:hypothetical protein